MRTLLALVVVASCTSFPVVAGDVWKKSHSLVKFGETTLAEFTTISSRELPHYESRVLFQDATGARVVERSSVLYEEGGELGLELISTTMSFEYRDEVLTIDLQGDHLTITCNSESFGLSDGYPLSRSDRERADELLEANASPGFRTALENLAGVGLSTADLRSSGNILRQIFFPDAREIPNVSVESNEVLRGFDPLIHEPSEFEKAFGRAYYE